LAWCYFQQKDYSKAFDGFLDAMGQVKDPALQKLCQFQVAETLFRKGDYSEARTAYMRFLELYPGDFLE
jgi:tetratricopeptide (TPR) repeat protein